MLISSKGNESYMNPHYLKDKIPEHSHRNFVYVRQTVCGYYVSPLGKGSKVIFLTSTEKLLPLWIFKHFGVPKLTEIMKALQKHIMTFTDEQIHSSNALN